MSTVGSIMNRTGAQNNMTSGGHGSISATEIITLFFGISAIITNGIILRLCTSNPTMKKDSRRLQIALAVADLVLGVGAVILTLDGWRIQFWNNWYTPYYCIMIGMTKFFGDAISLTLTFVMAVERFVAIWFPLWYRSMDKRKFAYILIMAALVLVIVFCSLSFVGVDSGKKPSSCSGSSVRIPALKPMLSYFNFAVGSAVVALYLLVILGIHIRKYQFSRVLCHDIGFETREMFKKEIEATRVVLVLIIGCIVFYVVPNVVVTIITMVNLKFNDGAYVSLLSLSHSSVNFVIYLWKDKKIRRAFINWTRGQTSSTVSSFKRLNTTVGTSEGHVDLELKRMDIYSVLKTS